MKWKCVKTEKPKEGTDYLVFDGDICIAHLDMGLWFKDNGCLLQDVEYYMDLPLQPERLSEKNDPKKIVCDSLNSMET